MVPQVSVLSFHPLPTTRYYKASQEPHPTTDACSYPTRPAHQPFHQGREGERREGTWTHVCQRISRWYTAYVRHGSGALEEISAVPIWWLSDFT
jgi:hypothetical protein